MTNKYSKRNKIILHFTLSFCILIFAFCIFAVKPANAAILYFSPSSGNFSVGNIVTVDVLVDTEGAAINNAEAVVNFPSGLLEVVSFSKTGSIFSLWVEEPAFSNSVGTLSFNGGLPTPGFNGASGKILSAVFRVKRAGSATVAFTSPAVRANDGFGTDILKNSVQALFTLIAVEPSPPIVSPTLTVPPVVGAPAVLTISSSTHPDQNKWYSNNNPVFQFKLPSDARELNLGLSRNEKSTPQVKYAPPVSEKIIKDVGEGVWYLHANYKGKNGLSQTATYKFQIDTGLPENIEVTRVNPQDTTNPKFDLRAIDNLSGIDRYEAKIDNGEWTRLSVDDSGYYPLPRQIPGMKQLTVRAYDRAGNYSESLGQDVLVEAVVVISPAKPTWYNTLETVFMVLAKGFDAVLNFIFDKWLLLLTLLVAGALVGQLLRKILPHLAGEIEKIKYIASEYRTQKKLKKLDHKTKLELKILAKDIKGELDLLNKIASHRSLHPEESYLRDKLEKYYSTLKKL